MRLKLRIILFCTLLAGILNTKAQQIVGEVLDRETRHALSGVQMLNIHNNASVLTDSQGHFRIEADKGDLVELHYPNYQVSRFRISRGIIPPYFKLLLDKTTILNKDPYASSQLTAYQIDSIKSRRLYKTALDYPRMSFFEKMESPFTAFSKSNQQKWAFQESFDAFQKEKYIDFSFNRELVKQISGLDGEDLDYYMRRYRPSYEMLRSMSTYEFYDYIKVTADRYIRMKGNHPRNAG